MIGLIFMMTKAEFAALRVGDRLLISYDSYVNTYHMTIHPSKDLVTVIERSEHQATIRLQGGRERDITGEEGKCSAINLSKINAELLSI